MTEDLLNEIQSSFFSARNGIKRIKSINGKNSYIYKYGDRYGVALDYEKTEKLVNERFTNVHLKTEMQVVDNLERYFLTLTTTLDEHKNEFASFCSHFVSLGEDGSNRRDILESPLKWWNKWSEIIGNKFIIKKPYSIIAELLALEKLYKQEAKVFWGGPKGTTIDIETSDSNYEIKSSLIKYENDITISSHFQLDNSKKLNLIYYKMEESSKGQSINVIMSRISNIRKVSDINDIEKKLKKKGYEIGASIRDKKYLVHEARIYNVDNNFPKITKYSFKDNKIPKNIKKITYTISLTNIGYDRWE